MSVEASPFALQDKMYSAEILRRGMYSPVLARGSTIGSVVGGLIAPSDLQASYAGSGLNVSVVAGECIVPGSSSTTQGGYYLRGSSATAIAPAGASAVNPRVDLIYAQVQDAAYTGSSNLGTITIATGTPTGGASLANLSGAPSLPPSSLALAYVLIPQSATSISNSDILNVSALARPQLSWLVPVAKSAAYTAVDGDFVEMSGLYTVTLPFPVKGAMVGVQSVNGTGSAPCTVATPSGAILGPGVASTATSVLLGEVGAYVILVADGTNWNIVAGAQDSGWQSFSFNSPWTASTSPGYRLTGNLVRMRGSVTSGGSSTSFATLPAGYQPAIQQLFVVSSSVSYFATVTVAPAGGCTPTFSSGSIIYLDPISFTVD